MIKNTYRFNSGFFALVLILILSFASESLPQYNQFGLKDFTVQSDALSLQEIPPEFAGLQFYQLSLFNETVPIQYSMIGMMALAYIAGTSGFYLTIGMQSLSTGAFTFVCQNLYLPAALYVATMQLLYIRFSLHQFIASNGIPISPSALFSFYVHYSLTPMLDPLASPFVQFDANVEYRLEDAQNGTDGDDDPTPADEPSVTKGVDDPNPQSPMSRVYYYGCKMPNLDLNNGENPAVGGGYAGDKNACGPTAATNSLKWLEQENESIDLGMTDRQVLDGLSGAMGREGGKGVSIDGFVKGKLEFAKANNIPINIKFQSETLKDHVASEDSQHFARNDNDGNYPTKEWLEQQMADNEDVELFYKWQGEDGKWRGHVVAMTGLEITEDGKVYVKYKHDVNQGGPGGAQQDVKRLITDDLGRLILVNPDGSGRKRYLAHAVAESPGEPFREEDVPVELTYFTGLANGSTVNLKWATATEINNLGFELLRNGEQIAFIQGKGTTTEKQTYTYSDPNMNAGKYLYELIQIDYDGTKTKTGSVEVIVDRISTYALSQNYPNPFNPVTKLKYTIPEEARVKILIYNLMGELVEEIVNQSLQAGSYEAVWDASNVSTGVYVYVLEAASAENNKYYRQSRKMTVLK